MRENLQRFCDEFTRAREQDFANNPFADFVRHELPLSIREVLAEQADAIIVKGSVGAGNWAFVPWVAVFDPLVTESATRGYYVVYLLSADGRTLYLSLNQGTTAVVEEFHAGARDVLIERAALMRARLPDFQGDFTTTQISLGSTQALPKGYEAGHALGVTYPADGLPSETRLRDDLQRIMAAYFTLTFRGGLEPTPEPSPENTRSVGEEDQGATENSLLETRRYKMHQRIERNRRTSARVKRVHGTTCAACGFSFEETYGSLGKGYIEAHHLRPLATLEPGAPVVFNIETDFAVLCANCHSMIHRMPDPADLDTFRERIHGPQPARE